MSSLIRARDFELDRMYRKCEQTVNASITKDDRVIPESGQQLSRLNEQIRVRIYILIILDSICFIHPLVELSKRRCQ